MICRAINYFKILRNKAKEFDVFLNVLVFLYHKLDVHLRLRIACYLLREKHFYSKSLCVTVRML